MGKGKGPTVVMPAPTAPTLYSKVDPLQGYQMAASLLSGLKKQTNEAQSVVDQQAGTPAELSAMQKGTNYTAASSYLSSLPSGDKYLAANTGATDPYSAIRSASTERVDSARQAYQDALQNVKQKRTPLDTDTVPEWAKSTIPEGMPNYANKLA